MPKSDWLIGTSPAFRLMIATSWLAPDSWQKNQEETIREAIGAGPDWTEYLFLVDRHRTPALSWATLSRVPGIVVPAPTKQELEKRSNACRVQSIRHCRELVRILKAFNHAGIPVMNLKGPMLSAELYGDVGLRQSNDLDLAVPPEDISRAQDCLIDLGWHLESTLISMTPRQWEKFHQMRDDLIFIHSQSGSELEIHSHNYWEPLDQSRARWARSISTVWQGCTHHGMNTIDQVLYLSSHGGAHAWFRAKWLGDLARIHAEGRVNWEAALGFARSIEQEKPLLACLKLLQIVHRLPLPRLHGNPLQNLPSFLIDSPLHALKVTKEPPARGALESLPDLLYMIRYTRLILPQKTWAESLSELLYCRQDFRMFPLPDSLFWAYAPLRPILFAWRKLSRIWA
ncbi:MAG TPA: nucleotidyltransferase family protein [Terracidiphilus sp.]|nr:nucleotidyltransferase family protein [Terracidiphilus sp.]